MDLGSPDLRHVFQNVLRLEETKSLRLKKKNDGNSDSMRLRVRKYCKEKSLIVSSNTPHRHDGKTSKIVADYGRLLFWIEDCSQEIKFLEGGFNPYGNGQIKFSFLVSGLQEDQAPQTDILLLNGFPDTIVDLGYVNFSMTGRNFTSYDIQLTRRQFVAQLCLCPSSSGPVVDLIPSDNAGTNFKISTSTDDLTSGYPYVLANFCSNANPVYLPDGRPVFFQTGIDRTIYVGPVFVPNGWALTFALATNSTTSFTGGQFAYTLTNSTSLPSSSSPSSITDVNIVGFSQVDQPMWVSTINPQAAIINPPPTNLLAGSFNAYGNEQIDDVRIRSVAELPDLLDKWDQPMANVDGVVRTTRRIQPRPVPTVRVNKTEASEVRKAVPFSGETNKDVFERLVSVFSKEKGIVGEYGQLVLDPEYQMMPFTEGFDYATEKDEKLRREKQAIGNGLVQHQQNLKKDTVSKVDKAIVNKIESEDKRQLSFVLQRLLVKIKSWEDVVRVILRSDKPIDTYMAGLLINAAIKKNVGSKDCADFWIASELAKGKKDGPIFSGLSNWVRPLADLKSHPCWVSWYNSHFSGSKPRVFCEESVFAPGSSVPYVRTATKIATNRALVKEQLSVEDMETLDREVRFELLTDPLEALIDPNSKSSLNGSHGEYTDTDDVESWVYVIDTSGDVKEGFNPYGNGQTTSKVLFPNSMQELEAGNSTLASVFETAGSISGNLINPIFEVSEITGLQGVQGVTFSNVANEMPIRPARVDANNAVVLVNDLNHPESLLYPITLRQAFVAAPIDNPVRPPTRGVGTVRMNQAHGMTISSDGLLVDEMVSRQSNIRSNQTSSGGFLTSDIAALIRQGGIRDGDSLITLYLKLYLYMLSRTWAQPTNFLPYGAEVGKFDARSRISPDSDCTLLYNDGSANFNSICSDGVTAEGCIQPFGNACRIAFHSGRGTVPADGYGNMYWISPGMLMQNDRGSEAINIAVTVLALAPYPCGIHQVQLETENENGDIVNQFFIPFSDLINLPGPADIHIILPMKGVYSLPTTQAAANNQVLVRPTLGPVGNAEIGVANAPLNVSFVDNVTYYNASNFLFTWMSGPMNDSPIDPTTIARYMNQLALIFTRERDRDLAYEMACTLAVNYPAMVESQVGVTNFPNTVAGQMAMQNFSALKPLVMTQNFPEYLQSWDYFLPSLNPIFWSGVMCGAYTPIEDGGQYPVHPRLVDGSPRLLQYAIMTARYYAVVMNATFIYSGLPTEVWNAAFTQLNYVNILSMIRGYFAKAAQNIGNPMLAENGYALGVAHCKLTGTRPASDMYGNTLYDYPNTPRQGFLAPITVDGDPLNSITPCVLADIWTQLNIKVKTLEMAPLLSNQKNMMGISLESGGVLGLGAGAYTTPVPLSGQYREVGLESIPELSSKALWNMRLVWNTFNCSLYTLDGNIYNVDVPQPNRLICQKSILSDFSTAALVDPSLLTSHTSWFPYMLLDGRRVVLGVTAGNGANRMTQIMARRTTTGAPMWMVNGTHVMPNTIVMSSGSNTVNRMIRRPGNASSSSSGSDLGVEEQKA